MATENCSESAQPGLVLDALALDRVIAAIDHRIAAQLDEITRNHAFKQIEAAWRGLAHLVSVAAAEEQVEIRVLSVQWRDIRDDIRRASRFDRSILFNKIYENGIGTAGVYPLGLILCDFAVAHDDEDVETIAGLAEIAAAAFAPILFPAAPRLLGIASFAELQPTRRSVAGGVQSLGTPGFLDSVRSSAAYERWRAFRQVREAQFVGIVLPRYLLRREEHDQAPEQSFLGRATRQLPAAADQLWGSGIYAVATVIVAAYGRSGWFTDMRGVRRSDPAGGLVPGLPSRRFAAERQNGAAIPPIEVDLDFQLAAQLDELGLIPLLRAEGTGELVLDSNSSLYSPPSAGTQQARSSARLSAMLQYTLCVSRFAHCLKFIQRDQIGVGATAATCQQAMQSWIRQYTTSDDDAPPARLAERPLRHAAIEVRERPGQPGLFQCTALLKPHFQLDQIVAPYELVTELSGLALG